MDIQEVIHKYFPETVHTSLEEYKEGAINLTYRLTVEEGGSKTDYKLQKMNPIFGVSLMEDIDFITKYLASKNIETQRVVRTSQGEMFVMDGVSWWRILTYLPGKIFSIITSPEQAREAGKLVGAFHSALIDCDYSFKFKLLHYHDVDFDIQKLRSTLTKNQDTGKYQQLKNLAENILTEYEKIPSNTVLPKRIIHDDLKLNNILFNDTGTKALAFIDIDTFTQGTLDVELGDALRDWCLLGGEDTNTPHFNKAAYEAALEGYFLKATFVTEEEKAAIPIGVKKMALELAARFTTDAFEENYFNLDSSKYKNLFEQNKKRAENQMAFFKEFSKQCGDDEN